MTEATASLRRRMESESCSSTSVRSRATGCLINTKSALQRTSDLMRAHSAAFDTVVIAIACMH